MYKVHSKNIHDLHFGVRLLLSFFTHILQSCFIGTGNIVNNPSIDGYLITQQKSTTKPCICVMGYTAKSRSPFDWQLLQLFKFKFEKNFIGFQKHQWLWQICDSHNTEIFYGLPICHLLTGWTAWEVTTIGSYVALCLIKMNLISDLRYQWLGTSSLSPVDFVEDPRYGFAFIVIFQ